MKKKLLASFAGVFLIGSAASAQESGPPKTAPIPRPTMNQQDFSRKFDKEYDSRIRLADQGGIVRASDVATCLTKKADGAAAASLIGGAMTNDTHYQALMAALRGPYKQCAPSTAISMYAISGALAEELVRREKPTLPDRSGPSEAPVIKAFAMPPASGLTMDSLGRCLAANSPGMSYHLLANPAGSPGEAQWLAALYAGTPECGVSTMPASIEIAEQRSAIATGLYRWLHRT